MENSTFKEPVEPREARSFLMARDPSIDRRCRPRPERQVTLFADISEDGSDSDVIADDEESASSSFLEPNSGLEEMPATTFTTTTTTTSALSCKSTDEIEGASIYLRLRPVHTAESTLYTINPSRDTLIVNPPNEAGGNANKTKASIEKHYSFSAVFDQFVPQREVYEQCIYQKIEDEENFSILAYGTSGSGKTFTLLGNEDSPGIIPRAIDHIFTLYKRNIYSLPAMKLINAKVKILEDVTVNNEIQLAKNLLANCSDVNNEYERMHAIIKAECSFTTRHITDVAVVIWISFAELYNEMVYDLLAPPASSSFAIRSGKRNHLKVISNNGKVFIKGLTSIFVNSSKEALQLLRYGLEHVNYASTSINENSSRSHCIFFIDILKYYGNGDITENSYKFSDLAGSERLQKTGNVGKRLKEAQSINTSLLVLGRCLDVANSNRFKKNNDVIPVRESKLTLLLQSSLLGKEKLALVVTVTPTDEYYEENLHVLGFSSIARNILYKQPEIRAKRTRYSLALMNMTAGQAGANNTAALDQLVRENISLRDEVERLLDANRALIDENMALKERHADALREQETYLRTNIVDNFQQAMTRQEQHFEDRLRLELACQKRMYEHKIELLKQAHEDEIEDLLEDPEDKENVADN